MLNLYLMDVDTTFWKCIRIQNPVDGTNIECGESGRCRVVPISTGRTERLSQRLTKLKPHLTPAPFRILNLYPIQGLTDTIFENCIQSKIIRIRFLKFVSNLQLFGYDLWNFCILIQNYPRYYNKMKSKSRNIQLHNEMNQNPVDVAYPKIRIQRCRP